MLVSRTYGLSTAGLQRLEWSILGVFRDLIPLDIRLLRRIQSRQRVVPS